MKGDWKIRGRRTKETQCPRIRQRVLGNYLPKLKRELRNRGETGGETVVKIHLITVHTYESRLERGPKGETKVSE